MNMDLPLTFVLTTDQRLAIDMWWADNDPDGMDYEFADNFRVAIKGDLESEQIYTDVAKGGCCGSLDVEIPLPDGRTLLFGFNCGH